VVVFTRRKDLRAKKKIQGAGRKKRGRGEGVGNNVGRELRWVGTDHVIPFGGGGLGRDLMMILRVGEGKGEEKGRMWGRKKKREARKKR